MEETILRINESHGLRASVVEPDLTPAGREGSLGRGDMDAPLTESLTCRCFDMFSKSREILTIQKIKPENIYFRNLCNLIEIILSLEAKMTAVNQSNTPAPNPQAFMLSRLHCFHGDRLRGFFVVVFSCITAKSCSQRNRLSVPRCINRLRTKGTSICQLPRIHPVKRSARPVAG